MEKQESQHSLTTLYGQQGHQEIVEHFWLICMHRMVQRQAVCLRKIYTAKTQTFIHCKIVR